MFNAETSIDQLDSLEKVKGLFFFVVKRKNSKKHFFNTTTAAEVAHFIIRDPWKLLFGNPRCGINCLLYPLLSTPISSPNMEWDNLLSCRKNEL